MTTVAIPAPGYLRLAGAALQKQADLTEQQRLLLLRQAQDAEQLEEAFVDDLVPAFQRLGEMAEAAALLVLEPGVAEAAALANAARFNQPYAKGVPSGIMVLKQTDAENVARIMRLLKISQWEQDALIPAWDGHYVRTLGMTVDTINSTLVLNVNIPDPVAREIVARGGTQRALLDIGGDTRSSIFRSLRAGRELGEGPFALARRIRDQVPPGRFVNAGPRYRATLIARTETKFAQNVSSLEAYKQSDVLDGVMVVDAQLGPTDSDCELVNGQFMTFEEAENLGELAHPNCTRSFSPHVRQD